MTGVEPGGPTFVVQRCGYTINGPKAGRRVVAWRKQCARKVRVREGLTWSPATHRCYLHGGQKPLNIGDQP